MSSLTEFLKSIADAIRKKKGTTDPINAQNFASEIESIVTIKKLLDETQNAAGLFMNRIQFNVLDYISVSDTSNVTSMAYMFYNCTSLTTIPLLDTSNVTNMINMFYFCKSLTTIPLLDTSKVTNVTAMFYNCTSLTTIPLLDTSKVTYVNNMFYNCKSLTTIPLLNLSKVIYKSSAYSMFTNCTSLTNLRISNLKVDLQIGSGSSWGHLLTIESLLFCCKGCIKQSSSRTLTVGTANLAKLANVYVDEDFNQVDSTAEGALLVEDRMALKSWSLA